MFSACSKSAQGCSHSNFRDFVDSGGDEASSPFLSDKAKRLSYWTTLPLTLLSGFLLILAYSLSLFDLPEPLTICLVILVYFLSGTKALQGAVEDFSRLNINIDVLMTLSAYLCAYMGSYFEGGLLLVLFDISKTMEKSVSSKARASMMLLRDLVPEKVFLAPNDGNLTTCHIQDVKVGMHIIIKAGDIVPLDGRICQGSSHVSLAHLTGESLPKKVGVGDTVSSGARALDGSFELEVLKPVQETTLTQIIKLIHDAQSSKPQLEKTFDKLSDGYAKSVILLSALLAFFLPMFITIPYLGPEGSIYRALTCLIAASPCALILAVPIAYLSALSACANAGIILKGGFIFDQLVKCQAIAFDKTGTLTESSLSVATLTKFGDELEGFEKAIVALEQRSSHPLAYALCEYYQNNHPLPDLDAIQVVAGQGMSATFANVPIRVGHADFALEVTSQILAAQVVEKIQALKQQGAVYCIAAQPHQVLLYTFKDQIRAQATASIAQLHQLGLSSYMLTGDHESSALRIAKSVGLHTVYYELSPEQKLTKITELSLKHPLAMVGDGINDAPALAKATVGIAMGAVGSPAANFAADVLLLHDDLSKLPWLLQKSYHVRRIIWQNLAFAGLAILFATLGALTGTLPLWAAVIAHEGGTVLVGLNGLRLMKIKKCKS